MVKKTSSSQLIVILGPTASGKTSLAVAVAKVLNGEIISADSRQVYRHMNIGTGKDLRLYEDTPYHLIDICEAGEAYHVARFQQDYQQALDTVIAAGHQPILCGGTGLYLQAAIRGLAYSGVPVSINCREALEQLERDALIQRLEALPLPPGFTADTSTKKRLIRAIEIAEWWQTAPPATPFSPPPISATIFGINPPVEERRKRITERLRQRLDEGLIDEVQGLLQRDIRPAQLIRYGLEYKYVTQHLMGELDRSALFSKLNTEIHRYAKRQMTFFRKMEKDGLKIHWLQSESSSGMAAELLETLQNG